IVVINGLEDPDDRASEAKKMLEWGFRSFETRTLFVANQPVGYAKVFGGESRSVKLAGHEPIKVMVPKNGSEKLIARVVYSGAAPMSPWKRRSMPPKPSPPVRPCAARSTGPVSSSSACSARAQRNSDHGRCSGEPSFRTREVHFI